MSEEHPVAGPADPLIGTVLAERYRIEKRLGEGGMGAVYLARHVILEKIVALKILHAEYARRRELVERFLHEAKAASRIRHEHVIDITDFGETADKNVFFAMEYLEGYDLATMLDRTGPVDWRRAKSIILQICAALQAAHEAGVIHRDLKPENIYLIERLGHPDFVKVLDFGVAKLTEIEEGRERRLTRTGMVFGTPEYMSPEQARGEKPDPRVDIYATGCILFEMLTGDVPFRGDNFMGVLSKHLFDPAPLLTERTHRADLPEGIQGVLTQAMAKDKNDRFASMNELAVALDTLDSTEGITYHAPTTLTPEKSRRHPVGGAAAAVAASVMAAGRPSAARQTPAGPPRTSAARPAPAAPGRPAVQGKKLVAESFDDDTETTLRKARPLQPVSLEHDETTDEQLPARGPRGFVVFLLGGAVAVGLGLGALFVVRSLRAGDPAAAPGPASVPVIEAPPPVVTSPVPDPTPVPAAAPPDAAPAVIPTAPEPEPVVEASPPDAGPEPTVITLEPEPEPEPEPEKPSRRSSSRRRDRRHAAPPVIVPDRPPVVAPPPAVHEPEPEPDPAPAHDPVTVPKSDLKDPFKRK